MKRAFVETPEGQLHYRFAGSGDPILLLHQTPSSSLEYLDVIPVLAAQYRVIAMDTVGFGDSVRPPRVYGIPDYAESVKGFLDGLGITKTHVAGHHTGATIALEFAATYPDMVDRLILDGLQYWLNDDDRAALLKDERFQVWDIKKDGSHLNRMKELFTKSRLPQVLSPDIINQIAVDAMKAGGDGEYAHKACFLYNQTPALYKIKSPTLLTSGTRDMFYETLEEVRGKIANCRIATFEGGIGVVPQQIPVEFANTIIAFLQDPNV